MLCLKVKQDGSDFAFQNDNQLNNFTLKNVYQKIVLLLTLLATFKIQKEWQIRKI